jgi:aldose 1-epimerase
MLGARTGKGGMELGLRSAVCLETQLFPDGMHHYGFSNPFLPAGQKLCTVTRYRFSQTP